MCSPEALVKASSGIRPPLLLLLMVLACSAGQRKDAPVVTELDIQGNRALSDSQIENKILTGETGWWPFARKRYFDPVEWHSDLARIERLYQSRGYYQARVADVQVKVKQASAQQRDERTHEEVELKVEVVENEPVRVSTLQVAGLEPLAEDERQRVLEDLPIDPGSKEIFREGDWEATKSQVLRRLRDLGHARARVDGQAAVDVGTGQAQLDINTAPGPRYRFGEMTADNGGRGAIPPDWVREQVQLAISEGETYSEKGLDEAQRRVFAMGVFSTVRVAAEGAPDAELRLPVVAHVREAPLHTLKLGVGAGFDQVRQEAHLQSEWTDRNWLGGLRRLQLRAMAGWAFIPSTLAVLRKSIDEGPRNGPIFRAGADFDQPRLLGRPSLRARTTLEGERTLEQTYDALGGRGMAGVSWEPHSTLTLFPAYNLQGYWLNGPSNATATSAPLTLGCTEDPCFVLLSYLEQIATWDTRDDRLEPRKGHYLSLSVQEGGGPLGGDFQYLRLLPEARGYLTLGNDDQFTLAARMRVGTLITGSGRPEDSAVTTRFYSGGSMWMRGFSIRRLSPMVLIQTPGTTNPESKLALPIGGNGMVEGNFELRSRFSESLVIATFLDYGTVTRRRQAVTDLHRMMWAVGFGVRYLTPVGALRADLGFRLPFGRPPPLYDDAGNEVTYQRLAGGGTVPGSETGGNTNDSCFGIGGSHRDTWVRDSLCAFHISIGEAF